MSKFHQTASAAIKNITSRQRVFVHGGACTPKVLLTSLVERHTELRDVELIHLHLEGKAPYAHPKCKESFRVVNLFVGPNVRPFLNYDSIDYLPCFLSQMPALFRSGRRPLDVALIHVSAPDQHGFCSLGASVDIALAAVQTAKVVIAQINDQMPRVFGDGLIHMSQILHYVEVSEPLPEIKEQPYTETEEKIGRYVAELVEDGSTLQVGIGSIPNAALKMLKDRKNLGLHTEMWSDGALELILAGVINNSNKIVHPGKTVSSFLLGTRKLYDFVNNNPSVIQLDVAYVNSPQTIARNPKVVAINSAVEIDLTGQICADSIGHRIISGVGGQMDFMQGASQCAEGKPIIALTSRAKNGKPRIVSSLKEGAGVVTTRSHAHYIITEYGEINLFGKTLAERARALISIAHPADRENLELEWKKIITYP